MKLRANSSQFQRSSEDEGAQDCSLRRNLDRVGELGEEMVIALRRLRRSQDECEQCRFIEGCLVKREFNLQVNIAIQEINEEWGLI